MHGQSVEGVAIEQGLLLLGDATTPLEQAWWRNSQFVMSDICALVCWLYYWIVADDLVPTTTIRCFVDWLACCSFVHLTYSYLAEPIFTKLLAIYE